MPRRPSSAASSSGEAALLDPAHCSFLERLVSRSPAPRFVIAPRLPVRANYKSSDALRPTSEVQAQTGDRCGAYGRFIRSVPFTLRRHGIFQRLPGSHGGSSSGMALADLGVGLPSFLASLSIRMDDLLLSQWT